LIARYGFGTESADLGFQQYRKERNPENEPHGERTGDDQSFHHMDYHFRGIIFLKVVKNRLED